MSNQSYQLLDVRLKKAKSYLCMEDKLMESLKFVGSVVKRDPENSSHFLIGDNSIHQRFLEVRKIKEEDIGYLLKLVYTRRKKVRMREEVVIYAESEEYAIYQASKCFPGFDVEEITIKK